MTRATLTAVPDTPPRAVLYLRQSTYREESISLELQETAGRDHCARHGYEVVDVLADPGVTGRTWKRPAVQKAMAMLENGDADVIVLWRWSRLSRNRKDWALAADRADVAGGRIESATEPNDVATAAGRFARGVMTELAAFESERIGEQWRDVQASRVARGLPPGGKLPWGWRWSSHGPAEVDPERGPVIAEAYRRYLAGAGGRELARWLNSTGHRPMHRDTWHGATVLQLLDSPVHAGLITYRGQTHPGAHEGVVDEATWRAYRAERARRREGREAKRRYLLSGTAVCSCGAPMTGFTIVKHTKQRQPWVGYRCTTLGKGQHAGRGAWSLAARYVEDPVLQWLAEVAADVDNVRVAAETAGVDARVEAQRLAREVAGVDAQLVRLTEQLVAGLVPEQAYAGTRDVLMARRGTLVAALEAAEAATVRTVEDPSGVARGLLAEWKGLAPEGRRAVLRSLVARVDVDVAARRATVVPAWAVRL